MEKAPAILLVPTALSATGTQLYKSLEIRDTTASTKYPIANPHQGKYRTEVSRYLGNTKYTGNSTKAWYLLAGGSDWHTSTTIAAFLALPAVSAFLTLNFTGSTPFTSRTGVKKEMRLSLPVMGLLIVCSGLVWLGGAILF